ncbi:response regulator transcription factor [Leucobacter aridicollis]|uniref:DNA-binding CsgD family transcriptional regulator n=1 Tax=Leucobacter aridicollis TaxID=283878 RepID=A0A852QSN9_9MICO|nr:helix-turn-helix transcriptional regulator [Leucobacter aridicollis]MBL3683490.1 helix-turn-helix transcriptional regulator [Leucobacter aridicollis]NYD25203.1 DNA-binding CsgD family transcriptional regulator [Leucobacter aridicollis]
MKRIVAALAQGRDVELIGAPGSGRTTFLGIVAKALEDEHWTTHQIHGREAYRAVPFAALSLSGLVGEVSGGSANSQLFEAVDYLARHIDSARTAILIDNVDQLDDASWAALVAHTASQPNTRIVASRARTGGAEDLKHRLPGLTVELPPLTYRELRASVEQRLGAPLDDVSLGLIFARSGASAGLAHDVLDAAVLNGQLRKEGNEWVAQSGLWSEELAGSIEALLARLDTAERDAIEILAIAGVSDLDTMLELVSWSVVEVLEARGLVRVHPVKGRLRIGAHPPILEDYFRHLPTLARRSHLSGLVAKALGNGGDTLMNVASNVDEAPTPENAVIARLFQEQANTRMQVARSDWSLAPSAQTALAAIRTMISAELPDAEIDAVFATELPSGQDKSTVTQLSLRRAEWLAYAHGDLAAALDLLDRTRFSDSREARMADAAAVSIEHGLSRVPVGYAERLEVSADIPAEVQVRMLRTLASIQTSSGDFRGASQTISRAEGTMRELEDFAIDSLRGVAHIGLGESAEAIRWARRGFSQAITTLDVDSLRSHAAVLIYALETDGRYAEAENVLATVLPLTYPPRTVAATASNVAILGCAALIAARRGRTSQAQRHLDSVRHGGRVDAPALHQSVIEAEAQLLISANHRDTAAALLWERGGDLSQRGFSFAGTLLKLGSIEVLADSTKLAEMSADVEALDSRFVETYYSALRYFDEESDVDPVSVAQDAVEAGRTGLALSVLEHAIAAARAEDADVLRAVRDRIRAEHADVVFEVRRFQPDRARLTDREAEVAQLVVAGHSNAEIATRLVLSVRTVESHIRRLTRKLGVAGRHEVRDAIQKLQA